MKDVFGKMLLSCLANGEARYILRRDDGYINEADGQIYFADYSQWSPIDREAIEYALGPRVLDVGAGAGRHSLYLQKLGYEVFAIDISPGAIEVMKKRGVENALIMDLKALEFSDEFFDTILIMFNNFGLAGTIQGMRDMLKSFYRISTKEGRVIATLVDPYKTDDPEHLKNHGKNREEGNLPGFVNLRIEFNGNLGGQVSLFLLSKEELEKVINGTGWKIFKTTVCDKKGFYGVVLEKEKK
jgi:SAM-dependent methyltransferase